MTTKTATHTPPRSVLVEFGKGPVTPKCGCFFTQCAEGANLMFCKMHQHAPDLLESLKDMFTIVGESLIEGDFDENPDKANIEAQHELARAAIAKARS